MNNGPAVSPSEQIPVRRIEVPGTAALTAMVAHGAGSRFERVEEHGAAHFLEHMVFKGGESFPTHRDVNGETDRLGARLNGFTSQELVAFHVRVRAERSMEAIDLLTDIVGRPRIDAVELDLERGVVIQEIARSDDQPRSRAIDLSGPATFGDHPLARTILGTESSLQGLDRNRLGAFRARCWAGGRGAVLLVGNTSGLDSDRLDELLRRLPLGGEPPPPEPPPATEPKVLVEERDSKQTHLVVTWRPGLDVSDHRVRAAFSVYAMLLGGSLGSRLVSEIREELGWAYSVRAEPDALSDTAVLYVNAGLDSDNAARALERMCEIVAELRDGGIGVDELERARSAAAGRRALAFENTTVAARHLAEEQILHGRLAVPEKLVADLDDVGLDEVEAVAAAMNGAPSLACVGPHRREDFDT